MVGKYEGEDVVVKKYEGEEVVVVGHTHGKREKHTHRDTQKERDRK